MLAHLVRLGYLLDWYHKRIWYPAAPAKGKSTHLLITKRG